MKSSVRFYFIIVALLIFVGCASPKAYVVLMENKDGTTGAVTASNNQGSQVIDQKGYGVDLYDVNKAPNSPYKVSDKKIKADFEQAMMAQPETPISFLLYFELGGSVLTKESQQSLEEFLTVIKKRSVPTIGIIGHTDLSGESQANYLLGLSRAESIRDMLLKAGLPAESIVEVTSHGETNPLIKTAKGVAEPRNRRVEVVVW